MSISWLNTTAFIGLAAIALPIVIHLLVRQQTRTVAYPSLRFLRPTALAAFRRRTLQDAPLLLCRIGMVAAAALALAGPVLQTPARTAGYAHRVARAIVIVDGDDQAAALESNAFRSARFARAATADALADALRWFEAQPPAARELVFVGQFRRGSIDRADLAAVPVEIGLRFIAAEAETAVTEARAPVLRRLDDALVRIDRILRLGPDATEVTGGAETAVPSDRISIMAASADQPLADAALSAALEAGVPWTEADRTIVVVWSGAEVSRRQAIPAGSAVVRMDVPDPPATAATAVLEAIAAATPRAATEPVVIPRERLTEWSRAPGRPSPSAVPADEGDRRWLWGLALALLALEHLLRRDSTRVDGHRSEAVRVA